MMRTLAIRCLRGSQRFARAAQAQAFPLFMTVGCRHWPTCSDYAIESVRTNGVIRGGVRAAARILRCNPFVVPKTT